MNRTRFWFSILALIGLILIVEAGYKGPTTNAGVDLIKRFEGFQPNFYKDPVGIKTIGYGHACHVGNKCADVKPPLSETQATVLLKNDLKSFENCVNTKVTYSGLNDAQFSALVSFAFNLGCGSLGSSTLLRFLNQGKVRDASREFGKWVNAGGKPLQGLVKRRDAERVLFCSKGGC